MFKHLAKYKDPAYFLFRILVGFGFFLHGSQKLFGWFGGLGGAKAELFSLMGLAGVIEVIGGLAIILGLFVSLVTLISAIEMVVAYFMVHLPQGFIPLTNYGESAWLYFAAFLVLLTHGAGKWSLDAMKKKK